MRVRVAAAVLAAASVVSILGAHSFQQQKTALVTVVAEASGKVAGLTAKDFVVKEDRATREVVAADPATEPLVIMLMVDTTQPRMGVPPSAQDLRRGLTSFVETIKAGNPDAQIGIMEFAGAAVTAVDITADTAAIDKHIQRLFPNRQADAVMIEAIVEAGNKLSDKPTPRRAIVSVDYNSPDSSGDRMMRQAGENVRKAGATVWAVSIRGTTASASNREEVLNVVTRASGGQRLSVVESTGLEVMLKSVANSLLSQYTVTFTRPDNANVKLTEMETSKGGKVLMTPWMR